MNASNRQTLTYLQDTYRFQIRTTVIAAGKLEDGRPWIAVRDSIAHPQGGGQPADVAEVAGRTVSPQRYRGDNPALQVVLVAEIDDASPLPQPDEGVDLAIDATARLLHAALHTAGHIVDASVRRRGFAHIVSNHFPGQARIEFTAMEQIAVPEAFVVDVQAELDQAVKDDLPIDSYEENGRRFVRIGDVSVDECGGTHLARTSQIGDAVVKSAKVKKGRLKVGYSAECLLARD